MFGLDCFGGGVVFRFCALLLGVFMVVWLLVAGLRVCGVCLFCEVCCLRVLIALLWRICLLLAAFWSLIVICCVGYVFWVVGWSAMR